MVLTYILSEALINVRVSQLLPQPFWLPVSSPPARLDLRSKHISDLLSQVPLHHPHTNPVIHMVRLSISPLHKYIYEHRPTSYWIILTISLSCVYVLYGVLPVFCSDNIGPASYQSVEIYWKEKFHVQYCILTKRNSCSKVGKIC